MLRSLPRPEADARITGIQGFDCSGMFDDDLEISGRGEEWCDSSSICISYISESKVKCILKFS